LKDIINFTSKFSELEVINPLITKYRINICQADIPANNYIFSKSVIEGMANTICGSGVYAYYFDKLDQLGGHSDDIVKTPYGYVRTPETVAYGFADIHKMPYWMEIDGENWYCADVYIWTGINPGIENILNNGVVWQSMQVAVDEEQQGQYKVVKDAVFLGFCLLQGIDPAYTGSTIAKFSFEDLGSKIDLLTSEINQLKQEYKQFSNQNKNQTDLQVNNELESVQLSNNENNTETNELNTLNINTSNNIEEFSNNNKQEKEEGENVEKEKIEFSLNSDQIREIFNIALSEYKYIDGIYESRRYYVETYDVEFVYLYDWKESKTYRMTYQIIDNVATIDFDSAEQVISGGYMPVKEDNNENIELSSNDNVDNAAMQELNEKSAEDNKELAEENLANPEEVNTSESEVANESEDKVIMSLKQELSDLQEKFSIIELDMNSCLEENKQLKEFKASIDKQNKEFAIEVTLKEVQNILPNEEVEACRLSAENFSLDDIDMWKNEVKAKAFNFSKGITEKKPFIQIAFPNADTPKRGTGLWD